MKQIGSMLALALAFLYASFAQAVPITFNFSLDGASEAPPNTSAGTGSGTVFIDAAAHQFGISVSFSGLTVGTTVVHIHCCTPNAGTGTAIPATVTPTLPDFPTGVTSGSYSRTFDATDESSFNDAFVSANGGTAAGAEAVLFQGIQDGKAYLNIHSSAFTGGEIRGFLVRPAAVPEPGSLLLLGVGTLIAVRLRSGVR